MPKAMLCCLLLFTIRLTLLGGSAGYLNYDVLRTDVNENKMTIGVVVKTYTRFKTDFKGFDNVNSMIESIYYIKYNTPQEFIPTAAEDFFPYLVLKQINKLYKTKNRLGYKKYLFYDGKFKLNDGKIVLQFRAFDSINEAKQYYKEKIKIESRNFKCIRCKGQGTILNFDDTNETCPKCQGSKVFSLQVPVLDDKDKRFKETLIFLKLINKNTPVFYK